MAGELDESFDDGQTSSSPAEGQRPSRICVHACGRLEAVEVSQLTLEDVCNSARRAFDLPSDLELLLHGADGLRLESDASLQGLASVYAELSESGLHDLEQRIDQLQHMQMSYVCDRLFSLREEHGATRMSLLALTESFQQEQTLRQHSEQSLRSEIGKECQELCRHFFQRLEASARETRQEACKEAQQALQESAQEARRDLAALEARLTQEIQDLRRDSRQSSSEDDINRVKSERSLQELREMARGATATAAEAVASVATAAAAAAESAKVERRERIVAEAAINDKLEEVSRALGRESQERMKQVEWLESTSAREDHREESLKELGEQLGVALENFRQETMQRFASHDTAASSQAVEALRRACEEVRRRTEESELAVGRMTHDLARRVQEEAQKREAQGTALLQKISEESRVRMESEGEVGRLLAALEEALGQEEEKRTTEMRKLVDSLQECWAAVDNERRNRDEAVGQLKYQLSEVCMPERNESEARLAQARLEEFDACIKAFRMELSETSDVVQKEAAERAEVVRQLREDCREAMQREISSRMLEAGKLREDLDAEVKARKDALAGIQRAISECGDDIPF
eukprot:TRINITY_DN38334_c0_g1_i2.p1 TRINITY_DN38334_c0_g1~~TRINITY_DN38334_c0_g1_i2.p1  ORF type:complete len:590 (+),score=179.56 TRINITY_DN38334_c0_g1_i2:23-1771(+)